MRQPLLAAYSAMPEPRRVAALGDCALGCDLLGSDGQQLGPVEEMLPVDVRIPAARRAPEAIAEALLALARRPALSSRITSRSAAFQAESSGRHGKTRA